MGPRPKASPGAQTPSTAPAGGGRELPRFFYRLSARDQRCYLRSDSIDRYDLEPSPTAFSLTNALVRALEHGSPLIVQRASQQLINELCRLVGVTPVRVEVRGVRPRNTLGELHGIFYPQGLARRASGNARASEPLIALWMRTAQRHDIVKPKTFFRTLMHELGHYLDYRLLRLEDSFHTSGFFKRESFLVRTLFSAQSNETPRT